MNQYEVNAMLSQYVPPSIPEIIWKLWPICICRIRGRVIRPIEGQDMPVNNDARVHICEVDPFLIIIKRLPDASIFFFG